MIIGDDEMTPAELAEEGRRRCGARQYSRRWAVFASNALRGYIGRQGIWLPDLVIDRIRLYIVRLREACEHYFLACPVCGFRRCPVCGQKFIHYPPDPLPCTCARRHRRSRRLAARTEENGTNGPTPSVPPLHTAFPLLYGQHE